jgi:hypothetical protein
MGWTKVEPNTSGVTVTVPFACEDGTVSLSWPEANELQFKLRQACVDAGITVMM